VTRERTEPGAPPGIHAVMPATLAGFVARITSYEADGTHGAGDREIASFVVPVIFCLADPFRIALDRPAGPGDRIGSLVSGLHAGPVDIAYCGPVSCLQIDLTPVGAGLFFRRPMAELTSRLVPLEDLGDPGLTALRDRLGATPTPAGRLRLAAAFLERRLLGRAADPQTAFVWSAIQNSRGTLRIDRLAGDLGWSRKRLAAHARDAFGLTPKRLARIARFHHAVDLAGRAPRPDWAGIAVDCGYADQAHLVRDFTALAGTSPERWRMRNAPSAPKQIFNPTGADRG
jgi:AraC-like DNA-binding protein